MGDRDKNYKSDFELEKTYLPTSSNPVREEATFEQLLGQLAIESTPLATEGSITQLFKRVGGAVSKTSNDPLPIDNGQQQNQVRPTPNLNSAEVKSSEDSGLAVLPTDHSKHQGPHNEGPGDFTRIFTKLPTPRTPSPALLDELRSPVPPATPQTKPGDFTQFFRKREPARDQSISPPPVNFSQSLRSEGTEGSPEPSARFSHSSSERPMQPIDATEHTSAVNGGFTELLRALESERTARDAAAPIQAPPTMATPLIFEPPVQSSGEGDDFSDFLGKSSAAHRSVPSVAAPGEFTQLLRSLQQQSGSNLGPAASPPVQDSLLEEATLAPNLPSAGTSEFTRVIQGGAARTSCAPKPPSAPQQDNSAAASPMSSAVSMPQPTPPSLPVSSIRTKLEGLTPWLLLINGVLLALLVVLASLLLLRHGR